MGLYDGFDDFDDGGFDHDADLNEDRPNDELSRNGLEWQDWMIIGPMSEEIAREKREKRKIEKDNSKDDDYLDIGP